MSTLTLNLSVNEKHVNEMVDRFDAGLCDPGKSNAVCLALREQVGLPEDFRVSFHQGRLRAGIDDEWVDLPGELAEWLRKAMEGWMVAPRRFRLRLPRKWLQPVPEQVRVPLAA